MTISYTWSVPQTDYTIDPTTGNIDRITAIHWRCVATEGEATSTSYGVVSVPEDDVAATPANMADEAAAITAAQRLIGGDVEPALATQLDVQAAPTQGSGRIWEIPTGTKVWRAGEAVAVNDVRVHKGTPYKALQAHTTQRGWAPDVTPALWAIHREMHSGPQPWVQPTGAHDAYAQDINWGGTEAVEVTWDNPNDGGAIWRYRSKIAANTTEPGRDGTFDRYWEPVSVVT